MRNEKFLSQILVNPLCQSGNQLLQYPKTLVVFPSDNTNFKKINEVATFFSDTILLSHIQIHSKEVIKNKGGKMKNESDNKNTS